MHISHLFYHIPRSYWCIALVVVQFNEMAQGFSCAISFLKTTALTTALVAQKLRPPVAPPATDDNASLAG